MQYDSKSLTGFNFNSISTVFYEQVQIKGGSNQGRSVNTIVLLFVVLSC